MMPKMDEEGPETTCAHRVKSVPNLNGQFAESASQRKGYRVKLWVSSTTTSSSSGGFGGMGAAIEMKSLGYQNILIVDREDDQVAPGMSTGIPASPWTSRPPRIRTGSSRIRTGHGYFPPARR